MRVQKPKKIKRSAMEKTVLLAVVGAGVGLFMALCIVRILYGIRLRWVLLICYALVFALAAFTDKRFLSIAFDSGVVASEGQTDLVMNAARAAGARGGTVLHGKGTGAKADPKFHNISIAEEKEVILIVSKSEEKSEIMRSILRKAGPDTPAKAVVFSLPTSEVAGFGFFDS